MNIAVHIVTWNGALFLPELFKSLSNQEGVDLYYRFYDNGSGDESVALINEWLSTRQGEIIVSPTNIGFSGGHNVLMAKATETYIAVLNQDVVLSKNYLLSLKKILDGNADYAAASGVLLRTNDSNDIDSAGLKITRYHKVLDIHTWPTALSHQEVFGVPAAAVLYKNQALQYVAYKKNDQHFVYPDTFQSYKEDVDLSYRFLLAGWKSVIVTGVIAKHARGLKEESGHTTRPSFANYNSYRNHWLFLNQTASFSWASYTGLCVLVFEALKFGWYLFTQPKTLWALQEVWQLRADTANKRAQNMAREWHAKYVSKWYGK